MKLKNYEKKYLAVFLSVIFIIFELITLLLLNIIKIYKYHIISSVVIKKDLALVVVSKTERKMLYDNSKFYLNANLVKYEIIEDRGVVLKKDKDSYYEILIKVKFDKNYKANDNITFSCKKEKIRLIEIFKSIWEGG